MVGHLKLLWEHNKWYFLVGSILLFGGAVSGFNNPEQFRSAVESMMGELRKIAESIVEENSTGHMIWLIFKNNVTSALFMLSLGCFFAIFPIASLLLNGVLLGYVLQEISARGQSWLEVFTVSILPHGIIELPAVIFAASIGIHYGILVMKSLRLIWRKDYIHEYKEEWVVNVKPLPTAVILIILALFVAAVIESTITPMLIRSLLGPQLSLSM